MHHPICRYRSQKLLFAGLRVAGDRAVGIMSLIATAKQNGNDPYAFLVDVLTCLPTHQSRQGNGLNVKNFRGKYLACNKA